MNEVSAGKKEAIVEGRQKVEEKRYSLHTSQLSCRAGALSQF